MTPNLIAAAICFVLGLLCGFGPTKLYYDAKDSKRIAEGHGAAIKARDAADKQRKETSDAWAANLEKILADKGAYERCVAAGRCGAVIRVLPGACPNGLPPSGHADDSRESAIPSPSGPPATTIETAVAGLIDDCRQAVGQLNALQADIERQPSWAK